MREVREMKGGGASQRCVQVLYKYVLLCSHLPCPHLRIHTVVHRIQRRVRQDPTARRANCTAARPRPFSIVLIVSGCVFGCVCRPCPCCFPSCCSCCVCVCTGTGTGTALAGPAAVSDIQSVLLQSVSQSHTHTRHVTRSADHCCDPCGYRV